MLKFNQSFSELLKGTIAFDTEEAQVEINEWKNSLAEYRPMNVDYWDYIASNHKLLPKENKGTIDQVVVPSVQAASTLGDLEGNRKKFVDLCRLNLLYFQKQQEQGMFLKIFSQSHLQNRPTVDDLVAQNVLSRLTKNAI